MLAGVLITHLHSDHVCALNDVITTHWVMTQGNVPLKVYGHGTHLDVAVDDLDATQSRIEMLGGSLDVANRLASRFEWRVMNDPDGNPFCIFSE